MTTRTNSALVIRDATRDDAHGIVEVMNTFAVVPHTVEDFLRQEELEARRGQFRHRWVLERDGRVEATAFLFWFPFFAPDELGAGIVVRPEARGHGDGSALLNVLIGFARARGATRLQGNVRDTEPELRAWAERRGFALHVHRFSSVLDLTSFDPAPHAHVLDRVRAAGIALRDMQGASDDAWDRLHVLYADLLAQAPDMRGLPRWTEAQVREALRDNPDVRPDRVLVAERDGEWLGLTVLSRHPRGTYNFLTGVVPHARGLGLARALKVEVIERARAQGETTMVTNNLSVNAPMLAVNRALGFVTQPGNWVMTRALT